MGKASGGNGWGEIMHRSFLKRQPAKFAPARRLELMAHSNLELGQKINFACQHMDTHFVNLGQSSLVHSMSVITTLGVAEEGRTFVCSLSIS